MNLRKFVNDKILDALKTCNIPSTFDALIVNGKRTSIPFYQSNCIMPIAKYLKCDPLILANQIASAINMNGLDNVKITGPGFIEIHLDQCWVADQCEIANLNPVDTIQKTVVVDYSGPNLAKEMHVGHLRSTIIGDCIARVLEHTGHNVIRQNHIGDWGTPFAMLLTHYNDTCNQDKDFSLKELESFYHEGKIRFEEDSDFSSRARSNVVKLQAKDPEITEQWKTFKQLSMMHANDIYSKLNVTLNQSHVYAESEYQDSLQSTVDDLKNKDIATISEDATVVFLEETRDKAGNINPVIIQKNDGAFLYITTDIAALKYRVDIIKADRIMYFVDARQSLHMKQLFLISEKAGYIKENVSVEHLSFGTMTNKNNQAFMSRSGNSIKLNSVLDEGISRAKELILKKSNDFTDEQVEEISYKVGIGAIKYFDLCKTRTNNYVFDWDLMLSFDGNTAPYLQYAYTRIQSILKKSGIDSTVKIFPIILNTEIEITLAIRLLQFNEVLEQVEVQAMPHLLCTYLYDLAGIFMCFYESCPILKDDIPEDLKISRIRLSGLMSNTLKTGLNLLGIEVMDKM